MNKSETKPWVKSERVFMRISPELKQHLEETAKKRNTTMSELIRKHLEKIE